LSGSGDKTIRLWNAKTGEQLQAPFEAHEGWVRSVAFSPDGKCIVSGSDDKTIRLWDAETGEQLQPPFKGHEDWITSVAFSPDGKCIVSGSGDKTIRLWNAEIAEQLQPSHRDQVAFPPDSKHIVLKSDDKTIKLWNANMDLQSKSLLREQHLIRYSSQMEHALIDLNELFDQITSLPISRLADLVVTSEGWVRIGPFSSLLFWAPPTYCPRWYSPSTQMIIPVMQLDLSKMTHGSSWHLCYNS